MHSSITARWKAAVLPAAAEAGSASSEQNLGMRWTRSSSSSSSSSSRHGEEVIHHDVLQFGGISTLYLADDDLVLGGGAGGEWVHVRGMLSTSGSTGVAQVVEVLQ